MQKKLYVWKFKCRVIKVQILWEGHKNLKKIPSLYYFDLFCNQSLISKKKHLFTSSELYITIFLKFHCLSLLTSIESKNLIFFGQIPHSFHAELLEKDHALLENSPFFATAGWYIWLITMRGNYFWKRIIVYIIKNNFVLYSN